MKPEEMSIGTEFGVIKVTLCAKDLSDMAALREELFNWYEDIAEREASLGRAVTTRHTSDQKIPGLEHISRKEPSEYVRTSDVESGSEIIGKLKNLLSAYIVLRSLDSKCGEVVQIPIRQEQYEDIIYKAYTFIDHVIQCYMGGYPF